MTDTIDRVAAEARFRDVFAHLGHVTAYARRRGSRDADAIAAEVMAIAWRRLADVPADDPRPWLYATARNLLLADRRRVRKAAAFVADVDGIARPPELLELDADLAGALRSLSPIDREALLLVAWDDLTPAQAARSLGINATAFRVRLLRARRRLRSKLDEPVREEPSDANAHLDLEAT